MNRRNLLKAFRPQDEMVFDRYNMVSEKDLTEAASRIEAGATSPVWAEYGHRPDEQERETAM